MSRIDELKALTRAWNDAWNSKDASKLASFFAEGATYYEPDFAEPKDGASGIAAVAEKTWADWPEASFEEVSVTVEDPRVVLEWRSSATHKSGTTLNLEGVDVLTWKGDTLTMARAYYDVHARKSALGD
jgi:uncharacterized protein (TIGR02246 family)